MSRLTCVYMGTFLFEIIYTVVIALLFYLLSARNDRCTGYITMLIHKYGKWHITHVNPMAWCVGGEWYA